MSAIVPLAAVSVWPTLAVPVTAGLPVAALFVVAAAVRLSETVSSSLQESPVFAQVRALPEVFGAVASAMAKVLAVMPLPTFSVSPVSAVFAAAGVTPSNPRLNSEPMRKS